jgi:hypothetical protein
MATCFDDPTRVFEDSICVLSVSKDLKGELRPPKHRAHDCTDHQCKSFQTIGEMKATIHTDPPCDSERARMLDGTLVVRNWATAYDTDIKLRGVHAGDFTWLGRGIELSGRMSGITNAGILRAPVFQPAAETCLEPRVMVGRMCGSVVKAPEGLAYLEHANIVAVYRFLLVDPHPNTPTAFKGTLEGALIPSCRT